jgi:hypothetical protein
MPLKPSGWWCEGHQFQNRVIVSSQTKMKLKDHKEKLPQKTLLNHTFMSIRTSLEPLLFLTAVLQIAMLNHNFELGLCLSRHRLLMASC